MMMSKPDTEEEDAPRPASATAAPPPATLNVGSVADLERRLAEMGTNTAAPVAAPPPPMPTVVAALPPPPAFAAAPVKGGKNALLARIMAAKEKQQKKPAPPPPLPAPAIVAAAPPADLLMDFDAPSTTDLPPPSYETNFLKDLPPPAFDAVEQKPPPMQQHEFLPPPPIDSILPPPPPLMGVLPPPMHGDNLLDMGAPSAPTATAPMFEDLSHPQEFHPPPLPPPMEAAPPPVPDIDESILNALEPAEREAFLEEQRKILEQIEREKSNNEASSAAARAMAFDQRSSNAVATVAATYEMGGRTQAMPTMSANATPEDMAAAAQLAADAELAEKLQKEEYAASERRRSRPAGSSSTNSSSSQQQQQQQQSSGAENQSWYDWLTGAPKTAGPPGTRSAAASSSSSSGATSSRSRGLVAAQTGEESRSYEESVGLMGNGNGGGGGGARVAKQPQSMFSCVADSMNTAVTQMYTFQADEEGNVHGVDSQGLLAMPDVSRQREN